jgi:hypothetical protein
MEWRNLPYIYAPIMRARRFTSRRARLTSASNPACVSCIRLSNILEAKGLGLTFLDVLFLLMFFRHIDQAVAWRHELACHFHWPLHRNFLVWIQPLLPLILTDFSVACLPPFSERCHRWSIEVPGFAYGYCQH